MTIKFDFDQNEETYVEINELNILYCTKKSNSRLLVNKVNHLLKMYNCNIRKTTINILVQPRKSSKI
jgi:hypothetical protein